MKRLGCIGTKAALAAAVIICVVLSAAQILTEPLANDEHMYLAAARMLDDHEIYRDFAFMQTPYMAYVYRWTMNLFPDAGMLLAARMLKLFLVSLSMILFYVLCLRFSGSSWMAVAFLLSLFASSVFRSDLHFARNYQLPLLLWMSALWLVDRELERGAYRLRSFFIAGVCLGLAVGFKLTFVVPGLAVGTALLVLVRPFRTAIRSLGGFACGTIAALLPAFWIFSRAGWARLWFNLVEYHRLNVQWRISGEYDQGMNLSGKIGLFAEQLADITNLTVFALVLALVVLLVMSREKRVFGDKRLILLSFLGAAAVLLFLVPTPAWIWYLNPLWLVLYLVSAALYRRLRTPGRKRFVHFFTVLMIVSSFMVAFSREAQLIDGLVNGEPGTAARLRSESRSLGNLMQKSGVRGTVATLLPLYALEADLPIFTELAAADFGYRVGYLVPAAQRRKFRIVSVDEIYDLLEMNPPAAIVCGVSQELEKPLIRFAEDQGYRSVRCLIRDARVYIRAEEKKEE